MRILVTGFEPFGAVDHNPSAAVLPLLPDRVGAVSVHKAVLPVDTEAVRLRLNELLDERYTAALHTGVAQERGVMTVERRAVNKLHFPIPDNRGIVVENQPIEVDGPPEIASRLPVDRILAALAAAGFDAAPSDSAGTYLCNQVMYTSLRTLPQAVPTGFIHLPPDETLGRDRAHQPLSVQAGALALALRVLLDDTLLIA